MKANTPSGRPRAQQIRSRETERKILEAAVRILGESGAVGLTTTAVSGVAGVSVGSIYRRFGNKEQLLLAAQKEFLRVFEGKLQEEMFAISISDAADPVLTVEHAARVLTWSFANSSAPLRVLLLEGLSHPVIHRDGHLASIRGGAMFAELVLRHRDAIAHDNPEAAADFAYRLIYGVCSHRLIQGDVLESTRRRTWSEVSDELTRAVRAYLLCP